MQLNTVRWPKLVKNVGFPRGLDEQEEKIAKALIRLGLSQDKIIKELLEEPNIRTVFTEFIYESHIAEVEGHTALALIIEGKSDDEIANKFNGVPGLEKNHGNDSIDEIKTIRPEKAETALS